MSFLKFSATNVLRNIIAGSTIRLFVFCALVVFLNSCKTSEQSAAQVFPSEINSLKEYEPGVRVVVNSPASMDTSKPTLLILYALPNGNTIEMTFGRSLGKDDDRHYDIQHIAAQTRFLRNTMKNKNIIIAYLEAKEKSWPAWRRKYPDNADIIARIVDFVRFDTGNPQEVYLCAHSGGGSFINGFTNAYEALPAYITRIIYLDANYSYDDSLKHGDKFLQWLQQDSLHTLCVVAYDDREITFKGKKVVGPMDGTFRATHRMLQRFKKDVTVSFHQDSTIQFYSALNNHARFIIHTNPDTVILHTILVERNGFIHSILMNTPYENKGYEFFGDRVYSNFIQKDIPWLKLP